MNDDQIRKFTKRIRVACRKFGISDVEDAEQDLLLKMLENPERISTIDQMLIDYLRKSSGDKRAAGYNVRKAIRDAHSFEQDGFDNFIQRDNGISNRDRCLDIQLSCLKTDTQRFVLTNLVVGETLGSISKMLGLSPSRISQIYSEVRNVIEREELKQKFINRIETTIRKDVRLLCQG